MPLSIYVTPADVQDRVGARPLLVRLKPSVEADSAEAKRANWLLNRKYGLTKRLVEPVFGLRYGKVVTITIRV